MVLLIIIPFLNGYFIEGIPHFQTNPHATKYCNSSLLTTAGCPSTIAATRSRAERSRTNGSCFPTDHRLSVGEKKKGPWCITSRFSEIMSPYFCSLNNVWILGFFHVVSINLNLNPIIVASSSSSQRLGKMSAGSLAPGLTIVLQGSLWISLGLGHRWARLGSPCHFPCWNHPF